MPKGFNGNSLCRYCGKEVETAKDSFCGPDCVHNFKIQASASYMRKEVFKRDKGVCNKCGLDTEKLRSILFKVKQEKGDAVYASLTEKYRIHYGYSFSLEKHAWEADHIIPVAHGGGSSGLDNLQTLCLPCHKAKTHNQLTQSWKRHYWKPR